MMSALVPMWIIGGSFVGLLILAFSFKGSSARGGSMPRLAGRPDQLGNDPSAPLLDPMAPGAPRRFV